MVTPLYGDLFSLAEHLVTVSVNKSSDINWSVCWEEGRREMLLITIMITPVQHSYLEMFSLQLWSSLVMFSTHFPLTQSGRARGVESVFVVSPYSSLSWPDLTSQEDRDTVSHS